MMEKRICACGCGEVIWKSAKAIRKNRTGLFFKDRAHHDAYSREHHPGAGCKIQRGYRRPVQQETAAKEGVTA